MTFPCSLVFYFVKSIHCPMRFIYAPNYTSAEKLLGTHYTITLVVSRNYLCTHYTITLVLEKKMLRTRYIIILVLAET